MFEVKWTGKYPTLCFGEWIIKKDGQDVSKYMPCRQAPMETYGEYDMWHFDDDYNEVWETYKNGMHFKKWSKKNEWINKICKNKKEKRELFKAIQKEDWRHGSCGGCI